LDPRIFLHDVFDNLKNKLLKEKNIDCGRIIDPNSTDGAVYVREYSLRIIMIEYDRRIYKIVQFNCN
jgi:hypothetical protein